MKLATDLVAYIENARLAEFGMLESLSMTSPNSLRVTLSRLVGEGKIYNPVKGVYVSKNADPFWVATHLYPGYVSLSSAFYLHSLMDEYPFTVFVASAKRKSLHMGGHEFLYFRAKNYAGVEKGGYEVASVEKAVYDSVLHGELIGYAKLAMVLYNSDLDSRKLLRICGREKSAFFQRLGYLLSILPSRSREKEEIMRYCRRKVKANVYLQGRGKGRYVGEWRIVDNVGLKVLLSWWRQ